MTGTNIRPILIAIAAGIGTTFGSRAVNVVAKPLEKFVTNSLEQHWMPFTANRDFKAAPRLITRSEGMYLWNQNEIGRASCRERV